MAKLKKISNDYFDLINNIKDKKIILFGVSYALLDFVEKYPVKSKNLIIIETGGMKGMRKEMVKSELHAILKSAFAKACNLAYTVFIIVPIASGSL